jgi:pimeloyl-ACP methyl ester carboxylesterase
MKAGWIGRRTAAVSLMAAVLAVCLVDDSRRVAVAEQASATPTSAPKQTPAHYFQNRPTVQARGGSNDVPSAATKTPVAAEPSPQPLRARAYLFRGALGPIFSRGMDALAEKIERAGVSADVYEFTLCGLVAATAIERYRKDPAPIILIGHSMGGRCTLQFAEALQAAGISAALVVTIDPAHLSPDVPLNVERFINIFLSKDILGGGDIKAVQGFRGSYASYDLAERDEVSHITIDKMDTIHQQLISKILRIAAMPANAEGGTIPLRYVVPPNQEIVLWDGGVAVPARSRDTLRTLALRYQLPSWSLGQINSMPDEAQLTAGARIIVPRQLESPATVPEPAAPKP